MYEVFGRFVHYFDGKFTEITADVLPDEVKQFLDAALAENAEEPSLDATIHRSLTGALLESVDSGFEGFDLFKVAPDIWYVDYAIGSGDTVDVTAIIITSLADYMTFRATWLAPIAMKVVQSIALDEQRAVWASETPMETIH